jgi:hypothetical protein
MKWICIVAKRLPENSHGWLQSALYSRLKPPEAVFSDKKTLRITGHENDRIATRQRPAVKTAKNYLSRLHCSGVQDRLYFSLNALEKLFGKLIY